MARARKPHPADIANANVVASAVRFEIALFLGVGRYATDTAGKLDEARSKAARLVAMHRNGRRPLIYGVTADGRSGLVTDMPNMEDALLHLVVDDHNAAHAGLSSARESRH